ncbi:winged helix-turn-helix transcriptional regulator [Aeromicrobium sp. Sec7.5]|uniref:winged helix-turn-helix transcriptional regulator n=1 Tax=Aeromicrobium sp. Sec7.5 TaxID=3121276 RepID=UPI002FE493A9
MLGSRYDDEVCSIARTLEVVGERWSLLILRNAVFAGTTRFGDFQRSLGIASNVLAARLEAFVSAEVMERVPSDLRPASREYRLTAKGRALTPVLVALTDWGDAWAAPHGPPIVYRHARCGGVVTGATVCAGCGQVHDSSSVVATPGPAMSPERAERVAARAAARLPVPEPGPASTDRSTRGDPS